MSIYSCTQCGMTPLRWRTGESFCYRHAVAAGFEMPKDEVVTQNEIGTAAPILRKPKCKETLAEKMAALRQQLEGSGEWEEEPLNYRPDLFAASRVEARRFQEFDLPFQGLDGEPKTTPF